MSSSIGILKPQGALDATNGKLLYQQVQSVLQQNVYAVLIDCTKLEFVDSSGLGVLVRILKTVEGAGKRFALCTVNDQFRTLLSLTDMEDVFEIFATPVHFKLSIAIHQQL